MHTLANYAVSVTRGRQYNEAPPKYRTDFQRDRDRIIHSSAFRRLEYKTQVFINHEGDLFRTRLTHSLEVAQVGRSVASALRLNVDLVEAICLAHDLGHTPFGHSGQDVLNECMVKHGEHFEHNLQSLRIVTELEERYAEFNGLNLTFETLEGILKHCSLSKAKELGELGLRFINKEQPSLEAQLANIADELAYNFHDLDDGLRANLLTLEQLEEVTIIREQLSLICSKYPQLAGRRLHKELVRHLINSSIYQLIESTMSNIAKHKIDNVSSDVRLAPPIVRYSDEYHALQRELKMFLHKNLYKHYTVMQLRYKAENVVRALFSAFISDPKILPPQFQNRIDKDGLPRVVADYISGMTDRYAFRQYNRLFTVENV
ncbi:deoxyguanosinetriphosphate triphosphohydrolase [Aquella oligotrophica]|uniref:Deoxyguanosinetriphosphate triphosphohydrolase-like protein n=1 Tax=Aquella oligotrophica TaxID=2067065 RepID=A0A2I7N3W4_9NEIS|nr:deoxyguanosinetriphosphate triphosphohydrolase [Aquella oligotrophica]AUR51154.1 deoxyguanosinetriphosphate triphosphohydrolase [Aquella oligotrophica]